MNSSENDMAEFGSVAGLSRKAGIALCFSSALTCLSAAGFAQDKPQAGGTLRVVTYEPLCLDQIEGTSRNTQTALQSIYDRLISESLDGKFHPWIASEWAISEDQLTYAFTIRDGVTFHDGTPLNAEAVRFNLQRWLDVKKAGGAPIESISSKDNVVTVKLSKAYSPLLHDLGEPALGFISPASIQKYSKEERCAGGPTITAGSGPFKVASRTPGRDLVLERNDSYNWAPKDAEHQGKAYLDRVELRFLKEDSVRVGAVESNQADIATGVPAISIEDIKSKSHLKLLQTQQPGIPWSFWLNQSKAPLDDVKVREALRVGVDYAGLIDAIFLGTATPAYTALTPAVALGYDASL
jgi:peptide/nickel transport system substrate-binding protein